MDKRAFGEAAKPEALEQANAIAAQTRRIGRPSQRRFRVLALEGAAGLASSTRTRTIARASLRRDLRHGIA